MRVGHLSRSRCTEGAECWSVFIVAPAALLSGLFIDPIQPAATYIFAPVEPADVGLDIEQGCAVQDIDILKVQQAALAADQAHQTQADGIRPTRCPRGEDTVGNILQE